jgi:predicted RNase H-like HicB family nuclease
MDLTAVIKKGERQYVALCPELDIVSQGSTVDEALKNLREAVDLYIEEMGLPEGVAEGETIVARFGVAAHAKTAKIVG